MFRKADRRGQQLKPASFIHAVLSLPGKETHSHPNVTGIHSLRNRQWNLASSPGKLASLRLPENSTEGWRHGLVSGGSTREASGPAESPVGQSPTILYMNDCTKAHPALPSSKQGASSSLGVRHLLELICT